MNPPHMAYTLTLKLSGDTWDDVMREFERYHIELQEHGPECAMVGGGGWVQIIHDPSMTPERYREDLQAWMQARKAEEAVKCRKTE